MLKPVPILISCKIQFQNKEIIPREFYQHLLAPQIDTKDLNGFNAQVFTENVEAVRKDGTRFSVDVRCKRTQVEHGIELLMVIYDHSSLTNDELRVRQLHEAIQKITAGIALIAKTGKLSFFNGSFKIGRAHV